MALEALTAGVGMPGELHGVLQQGGGMPGELHGVEIKRGGPCGSGLKSTISIVLLILNAYIYADNDNSLVFKFCRLF